MPPDGDASRGKGVVTNQPFLFFFFLLPTLSWPALVFSGSIFFRHSDEDFADFAIANLADCTKLVQIDPADHVVEEIADGVGADPCPSGQFRLRHPEFAKLPG